MVHFTTKHSTTLHRHMFTHTHTHTIEMTTTTTTIQHTHTHTHISQTKHQPLTRTYTTLRTATVIEKTTLNIHNNRIFHCSLGFSVRSLLHVKLPSFIRPLVPPSLSLCVRRRLLSVHNLDDCLFRFETKGQVLVLPPEPLATLPPGPEFILSPRRVAQILIKHQDSSRHNLAVHAL